MLSLVCLHRIQRRQMYVKLSVSTKNTQKTNVCQAIQRRKMYVKFNVSTQDTQETNVCQV